MKKKVGTPSDGKWGGDEAEALDEDEREIGEEDAHLYLDVNRRRESREGHDATLMEEEEAKEENQEEERGGSTLETNAAELEESLMRVPGRRTMMKTSKGDDDTSYWYETGR